MGENAECPYILDICVTSLNEVKKVQQYLFYIKLIHEKRPVALDELGEFEEVGACGTAAVISPIKKIVDQDTSITHEYCLNGNPGPVSVKLYNKLTAIQYGDQPDPYGWIEVID